MQRLKQFWSKFIEYKQLIFWRFSSLKDAEYGELKRSCIILGVQVNVCF